MHTAEMLKVIEKVVFAVLCTIVEEVAVVVACSFLRGKTPTTTSHFVITASDGHNDKENFEPR